jgi:hypothetical protein
MAATAKPESELLVTAQNDLSCVVLVVKQASLEWGWSFVAK